MYRQHYATLQVAIVLSISQTENALGLHHTSSMQVHVMFMHVHDLLGLLQLEYRKQQSYGMRLRDIREISTLAETYIYMCICAYIPPKTHEILALSCLQ